MTARAEPQCMTCRHFRSPFSVPAGAARPDGATCDAFPQGIPDPIFANKIDHRQPVAGDHGVQWEPDGDVEFPTFAFAESVLGH
jgi:hypothetical protein